MITSDIQARVRSTFGDATGIEITDTDIFNWINDAQRDIAVASDLMQTKAGAFVTAGQSDYSLPSDYLSIFSVSYQGNILRGMSTQEKNNFIASADNATIQGQTGIPVAYWIWAQTITLYPTPATTDGATQSLVCAYYRTPTLVTVGSSLLDLPIKYHNTILERVLQRCYEKDENWQAASIKEGQYSAEVAKMSQDAAFTETEAYPNITTASRDAGSGAFDGGTYDY